MAKATFELEWDDDLGKDWMNIFNLELCLYSSQSTKRELVKVREIKNIVPEDRDEDFKD